MKRLLRGAWVALVMTFAMSLPAHASEFIVTVAGLGGEPDYEQRFNGEAKDLDRLFKGVPATAGLRVFTLSGADATRAHLSDLLAQIAREAKPTDDFVLIMIGHGSFDGVEYKFNLVGPDISASDLAALCNRIASARQLIVNTTSCSGGSVPALQRRGRAIIAATKSGTEKNATVFARYFIEALQDPASDVDKNESISALEAFEYADRKTAEFYTSQKRLATEHPVFEDTGKNSAVRAPAADSPEGMLLSTVTLVRLGDAESSALDPAKRDLMAKKDDIERQIDILKYQKAAMSQDEYEKQLKALVIELAKVQAQLDQ